MLLSGNIFITLNGPWYEPITSSEADINAAERMRQFYVRNNLVSIIYSLCNYDISLKFGWIANPIFGNGDYPAVLKEFVAYRSEKEGFSKSRLPEFTQEEIAYIKGNS